MGVSQKALEAILVACSLVPYAAYHLYLLVWKRHQRKQHQFTDFFGAGKAARALWAEACADDEKEALYAVQTIRNSILAVSFLASVSALLASSVINILLDEAKVDRIARLYASDMIVGKAPGGPLFTPAIIMLIALGCLYTTFVCFAQSVRLYVHLGFVIRAIPSRLNAERHVLRREEAVAIAVRAGFAFTVGLRIFYLFLPIATWAAGPTILLITSTVMTLVIWSLDRFNIHVSGNDYMPHDHYKDLEQGSDTELVLGRRTPTPWEVSQRPPSRHGPGALRRATRADETGNGGNANGCGRQPAFAQSADDDNEPAKSGFVSIDGTSVAGNKSSR